MNNKDNLSIKNIGLMENKELSEIQSIASTLGLPSINEKNKLIKKINNFLLLKEKILKEQESNYNLNSFNKEFPLLKMTNNIESQELLFWRVFRDKFLFYKIFNNFIYKNIIKYNEIENVSSIFKNYINAESIIKDKVKSNKYLTFDINYNNQEFHSIFLSIYKNNLENQLFYKQLFKNYENYFTNFKLSMEQIILTNNLLVLKQFIEYFSIPSIKIREILSNLFNNEKFLLNSYKKDEYINNEIKFQLNSYQRFKIINYLQINYQLPNNSSIEFYEIGIFNKDKFIKFKQFLNVMLLIKSNEKFQKNGKTNENDEQLIKEIENFKNQFSKDQLNLSTENIIILLSKHSNDNNIQIKNNQLKQFINSLLKIYFSFFRLSYENKTILFKEKFNENGIHVTDILNYFDNFNYFLIKCKNQNEQIQFLSNLKESFNKLFKQKYYTNNLYLDLLYRLIEFNDIQLLDHYLNTTFKEENITINKNNEEELTKSIKSKEILDYFFNIKDQIELKQLIFKDQNKTWKYISNIELLEYYETLMSKFKFKFLVYNFFNTWEFKTLLNKNKILDFLERSFRNPSIYEFENNIKFYENIYIESIKYGKNELLFHLIDNGYLKSIDLNKLFEGYNNNNKKLVFLNWVYRKIRNQIPILNEIGPYKNFQFIIDLENNNIINSELIIEIKFENLISLILLNGESKECLECFQLIETNDEPYFTDLIFNHFKNYFTNQKIILFLDYLKQNSNMDTTNYFDDILDLILSNGKLQVLKYIVLNFGIHLNQISLMEYLIILAENNFMEMIDIFLHFIEIEIQNFLFIKEIFKNIRLVKFKKDKSQGYYYLKKIYKN